MLCDYGCGKEALFQFKNGKWCCSKNWGSCLVSKMNNSIVQRVVQNRREVIEKKSESGKKKIFSEQYRMNLKKAQNTPSVKKRKSDAQKESWRNKTDEEKVEIYSKIFKSNKRKPNKAEIFTDSLIQFARPTEFKYSGDGQIWIAGKCPDWVNVNGKKQVIEYFSNYFHGEKYRRKVRKDFSTNKEHEQNRINHFKKYGFDCLVIWEYELKEKDLLMQKIKDF